MTDDTAGAMAHLRQSCAIAAGKAPAPTMTDMFTGEARQVTCWEAGGWYSCPQCGKTCLVLTDGSIEWVSCRSCETVTGIPWYEPTQT